MNPTVFSRKTIAVATGLAICISYGSIIRAMVRVWLTDEDMSHGILVLPVIAWIVYTDRERLRALRARPNRWGWLVLLIGAALQLASVRGAGVFVGSAALIITVAGSVLCLGGMPWFRALAFPFVLSLFMLPKLSYFYNELTLPLQLVASSMAAGMLTASGFDVIRAGNLLTVSGHQVSVEAACNGLRYVFPLAFLSLVLAHLGHSTFWIRSALLTAALIAAVLGNAARVAIAAASPQLAIGTGHTLTGLAVFLLTLSTLFAAYRLLRLIGRRTSA